MSAAGICSLKTQKKQFPIHLHNKNALHTYIQGSWGKTDGGEGQKVE